MSTIISAIKRAQARSPVNVELLARELGIAVVKRPMPDDISGQLVRTPLGYQIHVNALHALTRQRFTIAHELGHYVYHRELIGQGINDNRAYRTVSTAKYYNPKIKPKQETEANQFAASLLMPDDLVESFRSQGLSAAAMARELGVSKHAMSIRLGVPHDNAA